MLSFVTKEHLYCFEEQCWGRAVVLLVCSNYFAHRILRSPVLKVECSMVYEDDSWYIPSSGP